MSKRSLACVSFSLSVLVAVAASGCGGDDGATEASAIITVDEGGSVELEGSVLEVPAAAVTEDTEVTMRLQAVGDLAPLEDAHDDALTIEPDDITFAVASSLTLDLGGALGEDETAQVYRLIDGGWAQLESQLVSGGLVQVSITGLGSYALVRRTATAGDGSIAGTLSWGSGDAAADVPVELHQGDELVGQDTTDEAGGFDFAALEPGDYHVVISFECELDEAVTVTAGAATEVDLTLCGT